MLLERYIFEVLKMNPDASSISSLVKKLNDNRDELVEIVEKGGSKGFLFDFDGSVLDVPLYNFVLNCNDRLEKLGEGSFRNAYTVSNEEWVLKIAKNKLGVDSNKEEIEISGGTHGLSARDIFIKVYDYDRVGDEPFWLICQKVVPLYEINDLDVLKKAFPTFWNIMHEEDANRRSADAFRYMLDGVFSSFGSVLGSSSGGDVKRVFYEAVKLNVSSCVDFDDVVFYEDFKRLSSAYAYIRSNDMHEGNFGLTSLKNPSPESIVILDFSTDYHI
jgi:hypothetical protein